jgi:ABC-2 type transport system ATP-binding protein
MRVLTGYLPATSGRAIVSGFDVFEHPLEAKRRTGYLPETPPLYPEMSVRDYLGFVAEIKGVPARERKSRVDASMEKARVTDMAARLCGKLSKGYRQRVGLAQALIHNPEVLILDEPTAGLDPKQIIETRELITHLAGDHTVILSTHILPEVAQTCQRVVIIARGRVVAVDSPDNLTRRLGGAQTIYVQIDGDSDGAPAALRRVEGITRVTEVDRQDRVIGLEVDSAAGLDLRREIARVVVTSGWGLLEIRPVRMSLEDIFLQLTTEEHSGEAVIE